MNIDFKENLNNGNDGDTNSRFEQTPNPIDGNPKTWGPVSQWTENIWAQFEELHETGNSGETLMKKLGLNRRKDLENIYYKLSLRKGKLLDIHWDEDYEDNARRLPDLKMAKAGLTISDTRFKRLGLDLPIGTYFLLEKVGDKEFKLLVD